VSDKAPWIISIGLILAGFASGGLYSTAPAGDKGHIWLLNRLTGQLLVCDGRDCVSPRQ
jgi:hypothetical protein